jgi:hypothetical protein
MCPDIRIIRCCASDEPKLIFGVIAKEVLYCFQSVFTLLEGPAARAEDAEDALALPVAKTMADSDSVFEESMLNQHGLYIAR